LLRISAVGQSVDVQIRIGTLVLSARPSAFYGGGGVTTLRLVDAGGNPVPGVQLSGTCTGVGGALVSTAPHNNGTGITNSNGEAQFAVVAQNLNQNNAAGSGTCTYIVPGGTPSAIVRVQGVDLCDSAFSPPNPGCEEEDPPAQATLTLVLAGAGLDTAAIATSSPAGINCSKPSGASQNCTASFTDGESVSLAVTPQPSDTVAGAGRVTFTGDCLPSALPGSGDTGATRTASVLMNGARTCTATVASP
jgi:hypothetical protein